MKLLGANQTERSGGVDKEAMVVTATLLGGDDANQIWKTSLL